MVDTKVMRALAQEHEGNGFATSRLLREAADEIDAGRNERLMTYREWWHKVIVGMQSGRTLATIVTDTEEMAHMQLHAERPVST